jgi:N6-adenosine-specific RNA methylase IME4
MKYQLLPRLSPEEFEALERSIIAHGVLVPVEYDEAGEIIDGHHRVEICESLGLVDWPRFVRKGLSEVDKRTLSRELNFARRHPPRRTPAAAPYGAPGAYGNDGFARAGDRARQGRRQVSGHLCRSALALRRPLGSDRPRKERGKSLSDDGFRDIAGLFKEIGEPATDAAVLFLWATNPMLHDGLRVMAAWGFDYVHHWIWDKEVAGTGYWGRDRHELLLIGRRGNVASPLPGSQPETVYRERKGKHSQKPDFFAETIERLYPAMPRLELFCRKPRPGWDVWGFEASDAAEEPISPPEGEMPGRAEGGAVPPADDDRPSVTSAELTEFKMLGAVARHSDHVRHAGHWRER